jgi:hypothetical protein
MRGLRSRAATQFADLELEAGDPHAALRLLNLVPPTHGPVVWSQAQSLAATGDLESAVKMWDKAIENTDRGLRRFNSESLSHRVVLRGRIWALMGKARVLSGPTVPNLGFTAAGLQAARDAVTAAEINARWDPNEVGARFDLATAQSRLAELLTSNPAAAADLYAKSIATMERFVRPGQPMRQNWRKDLANARWQLAQTLDRLNRREEALLQARQSLGLLESTHARNTLADLMLGAGDRDGAMQEYQRALSFAEARVAAKPRMMPWRNELADIYERIARWHERAGDFLTASTWHKKSLAMWKEWPKWGVSSSYDQQRLRQAEKAVTTCGTKRQKNERNTSAVPLDELRGYR